MNQVTDLQDRKVFATKKEPARPKINAGLASSFRQRKATSVSCGVCGKQTNMAELPIHMYNVHKVVISHRELAGEINANPGLKAMEYRRRLGWSYSKFSNTVKKLAASGVIVISNDKRLYPAPVFADISIDEPYRFDEDEGDTEFGTINVIYGKAGNTYTVVDGNLYRVVLEKVV